MEIARAAAGLFMRNGLRATRAEDIARAAGIAPRTFYRYFATKEESLGPLFAAGAQRWADAVRDAPADLPVPEALRRAVVSTLTPGAGVRYASLDSVRSLLRLAEANPALLRVWGEACQTAERTLAAVLAVRAGAGAAPGAEAGVGAGADAVMPGPVSPGAGSGSGPGAAALGRVTPDKASPAAGPATRSGSGSKVARGGGEGSRGPVVSEVAGLDPGLRFTAAVASAAVRVAVESWAAGDATPDGPGGPVALALRNLGALDDFPWGTGTE
ncbi:TetR family transcriptional regulator [Streptomyces sp. NPDC007084]|uniref:TetR/AcrR family transcriptional regulator n=1 Tax=Streptomyces sp. NPDC007084 TaxID=3154313 RepID=UPI0034549417